MPNSQDQFIKHFNAGISASSKSSLNSFIGSNSNKCLSSLSYSYQQPRVLHKKSLFTTSTTTSNNIFDIDQYQQNKSILSLLDTDIDNKKYSDDKYCVENYTNQPLPDFTDKTNLDSINNTSVLIGKNHFNTRENKKFANSASSSSSLDTINKTDQEFHDQSLLLSESLDKYLSKDLITNNELFDGKLHEIFQENLEEINQYDENKVEDAVNENKLEDFFTNDDLKKYLLQSVSNPYIYTDKENKIFLENIKPLFNTDNIILNNTQQKMVDILGTKSFPKKFKPHMFYRDALRYKLNLMDKQLFKYKQYLLDNDTRRIYSIPVLIPGYLRILPDDSKALVEFKMRELKNLKINYIAYHQFIKSVKKLHKKCISANIIDQKYQNKFLLICADKIEDIDKPEIFVFIPDNCFDKDMKLIKSIAKCNIRPMFFEESLYYHKFEFGCYKFLMNNTEEDNDLYIRDREVLSKSIVENEYNNDQEIIEALEKFEKRVKLSIEKIQDEFLKKNINTTLESKHSLVTYKRKRENKQSNYNKKKSKTDFDSCLNENNVSDYVKIKQLFIDIENKIFTKYEQTVRDNIDIVKELKEKCGFNDSELTNILNSIFIQRIKENISKDLKTYNIDIIQNFQKPRHAIILLPMKYYLYKSDDNISRNIKQRNLISSPIERYYCAYLGKTCSRLVNNNLHDNKVIAALTQEIDVKDTNTDNKIIVLIYNEASYNGNYENVNLFDPNKFVLHGYFYNDVKIHTDKVEYPLYEFYIDKKFNIRYPDSDYHRNNYIARLPNIDEMTLVEYLKQAYIEFNQRVIVKAKYYQLRAKER